MPSEQRPLKVFLCHASLDKPKVRELYRYLRKRGIRPWFDEVDLVGGQDWQVEIPKALATSDAIIICLTKNSVDREGYIQKEIKFALDKALEMPEGRIFLIPVRFEECEVPFSLSRYQWVDLFNETGYGRMMRALKFRASQLKRATVETLRKDVGENNSASRKATSEKEEREIPEKDAREKIELQQAEEVAPEKLELKIAEKARNEQVVREATKEAENNDLISNFVEEELGQESYQLDSKELETQSNLGLKRFLWIGVLIAIIFVISILSFNNKNMFPGTVPTPTRTSLASVSATASKTSVLMPTKTPTETSTPDPTPTITLGIGSSLISKKDGMKLLYVPAGEFIMGSNSGEWDEKPAHRVNLASFWIDQTEITNAMYAKCVDNQVCDPPDFIGSSTRASYYGNYEFDNYPVIYVSWNDAVSYCEWADRRLPNEPEWEKAARGTDERAYPWGNTAPDDTLLNFNLNIGDTVAVGIYKRGASPYGIYDMSGNVFEWVNDVYDVYSGGKWAPFSDYLRNTRVLRGGSWDFGRWLVRTTLRHGENALVSANGIGFRCAMDATP